MDSFERIPSRLAEIWKSFFGLYTQYVGHFTPSMAKTILQIKRNCDNAPDEEFNDLDVSHINDYARKLGFKELPYKKEIDDVLPRLWDYLKDYDLSDFTVPPEQWNELMKYLDVCETRKRF